MIKFEFIALFQIGQLLDEKNSKVRKLASLEIERFDDIFLHLALICFIIFACIAIISVLVFPNSFN
jgi:hypothetical protein